MALLCAGEIPVEIAHGLPGHLAPDTEAADIAAQHKLGVRREVVAQAQTNQRIEPGHVAGIRKGAPATDRQIANVQAGG